MRSNREIRTEEVNEFINNFYLNEEDSGEEVVDIMDVITTLRGWLPLIKNEEMTVTFNEKQYKIKRIK